MRTGQRGIVGVHQRGVVGRHADTRNLPMHASRSARCWSVRLSTLLEVGRGGEPVAQLPAIVVPLLLGDVLEERYVLVAPGHRLSPSREAAESLTFCSPSGGAGGVAAPRASDVQAAPCSPGSLSRVTGLGHDAGQRLRDSVAEREHLVLGEMLVDAAATPSRRRPPCRTRPRRPTCCGRAVAAARHPSCVCRVWRWPRKLPPMPTCLIASSAMVSSSTATPATMRAFHE